MKKTLVALMALAGVAMADVTLGSYYTVDGVNYDAVANFYGYTKNEIVAKPGVKCDKLAFDANSISNLNAVALNTGDMLSSDSTLTAGTELELNSLSMLARDDSDDKHQGAGSTVSITLGDVTYTSDVAVYSNSGTGHDLVTYTFVDTLPTFELGDTLTFTFTLADGSIADVNKVPVAALQGLSAAPTVFNGVWQAAIQLDVNAVVADTPAVPEPTTATLSLLALAGLAARRRRK